jgi:hypothetical protein
MSTFSEANQVRLSLKMKFSQYGWYKASHIVSSDDGFAIVVSITHLDNKVRKIISPVVDGISIKTEVDQK